MSAIRRIDRRAARKVQSSPYARQALPKKSSWSISGLLNYFNPLRSKSIVADGASQSESDDHSSVSDDDDDDDSAAETISARGRQLSHDMSVHEYPNTMIESSGSNKVQSFAPMQSYSAFPVPTALTTPTHQDKQISLNSPSPSPAKNLETVTAFLTQKAGQPLNEVEAEGLVSLIQKSTQNDDKYEAFRFSNSSSSTPVRGNSPSFDFATRSSSTGTDSQSPQKTLKKNPNGVYRWDGGRSAQPRNRFRSPSFGPPRPPPANIKLLPPDNPRTDTKRRRVGEGAESSPSDRIPAPSASLSGIRSSAPSPSQPTEASLPFPVSRGTSPSLISKFSSPKVNGVSTPRLRISALPSKPTVPAVPSPLRQAWGENDSSSPSQSASSKPTKAANFMQDLIKEVTPLKRPDVSNPYQTASPVKPLTKKPVVKRTRATVKSAAPLEQKEPELSPQAIIEATVPKGSKRSRPPANFEKPSDGDGSSLPRRSPREQTIELPIVNGVESTSHVPDANIKSPLGEAPDGEAGRTAKKQKIMNESNGTTREPVVMEVVEGVGRPVPTPARPFEHTESSDNSGIKSPSTNGFVPSIPSGGSSPTGSRLSFSGKSSAPKEPSKLRFSYQPEGTPTPQPFQSMQAGGKVAETEKQKKLDPKEPKDVALVMDVDILPEFSFVFRESSNLVRLSDVALQVKAAPTSSLPTFDFSGMVTPNKPASAEVKASSVTPLEFDWAAAGMKAPAQPSGASWTCSTCMLTNPATATGECTVCEAPR